MQSMPPVKGFIPLSFIDWPSRMSSVLFTGGCNFHCPFCHNAALVSDFDKMSDIMVENMLRQIRKNKEWVDSVVISGGEPTIHRDLPTLIGVLKAEGMKIKLDTNGSNVDMVCDLVDHGLVDYIAMDVKGPTDRYAKWCGSEANTMSIEESVRFLIEGKVDYEFRMTVVPTLHSEEDVRSVSHWLKGAKRFTLQSFRPVADLLDPSFSEIKPLTDVEIKHLKKISKEIINQK